MLYLLNYHRNAGTSNMLLNWNHEWWNKLILMIIFHFHVSIKCWYSWKWHRFDYDFDHIQTYHSYACYSLPDRLVKTIGVFTSKMFCVLFAWSVTPNSVTEIGNTATKSWWNKAFHWSISQNYSRFLIFNVWNIFNKKNIEDNKHSKNYLYDAKYFYLESF